MSTSVTLEPARYRLGVVIGDSLDVTFPLETAAGDDADLTGYSVEADVVGLASGTRVAFTATISGSSVRLTMTPAVSATLDELGRFDVRLSKSGAVVTPVAGTVFAAAAVTVLS